jgi:hypothetical protein
MTHLLIDAHNHIGDISATGAVTQSASATPPVGDGLIESSDGRIDQDMRQRLQVLDRNHVDQAVVICAHAHLRPDGIADTRRVNDTVVVPLIERCGAGRLVYGSDLHSGEHGLLPSDPLPDILAADLSEQDRAAILGGNTAGILSLDQPRSIR